MNDFLQYLILGIIQGFTEPLPISSSGHVLIFQQLMNVNLEDGLSFAAFINFGSTIAIIFWFRHTIIDLIVGGLGFLSSKGKKYKNEWNYILKIVVATIPLVIAGVSLKVFNIEFSETISAIGYALFITSLALFYVSNKKNGTISTSTLTYKQAIFIGIFQAIALLPGLSRSGLTMTAALIIGMANEEAFNFSFIMFIPASFGALLFSMIGIAQDPTLGSNLVNYLTSFLMAAIFTWIGLIITKKVVMAAKLKYFAYYCLAVSILITSIHFL